MRLTRGIMKPMIAQILEYRNRRHPKARTLMRERWSHAIKAMMVAKSNMLRDVSKMTRVKPCAQRCSNEMAWLLRAWEAKSRT